MEARMVARMGSRAAALFLAGFVAGCEPYAPTGLQGGLVENDPAASALGDPSLILLYDYGISTGGITIPAGTAVEWRNVSSTAHTVSNYSTHPNADAWDDALVGPGGEFTHVFDDPGEYGFVCIFHQDVGYITVLPSDMGDMDMNDTMDMDMDDMMGMMP